MADRPGPAQPPLPPLTPQRPLQGLRVLLVLGTSTGGVGAHVRSLGDGLVARGAEVTVGAPEPTDAVFDFTAGGAAFTPVAIGSGVRVASAGARRRLSAALAGADVVHAHGLRAGVVTGGVRPGQLPPLVVTWHNALLSSGPRAGVHRVLERVAARRADVTLAASPDLAADARAAGGRDVRYLPVAAPTLPPSTRDTAGFRAELDAGDRPIVLGVGRLHPQKRWDVLVDAAARWSARRTVPLTLVAGDGPLAASLAARARRTGAALRLLGRRDDVADLLSVADVVVLTSAWEARALVAQEALRAGCALVATPVGGLPDLVGDAAVLVPVGDVAALSSAVTRLLDDPALREGLGARARAQAATWPTLDEAVDEVAAVYLELVGHGA